MGSTGCTRHFTDAGTWNKRREFAKTLGYRVALIARKPEYLNSLAEEISKSGGEVCTLSTRSTSRREQPVLLHRLIVSHVTGPADPYRIL